MFEHIYLCYRMGHFLKHKMTQQRSVVRIHSVLEDEQQNGQEFSHQVFQQTHSTLLHMQTLPSNSKLISEEVKPVRTWVLK